MIGRLLIVIAVALTACRDSTSTSPHRTSHAGDTDAGDGLTGDPAGGDRAGSDDLEPGDPHGMGDTHPVGDAAVQGDGLGGDGPNAGDSSFDSTCLDAAPTSDPLHLGRNSRLEVMTWNLHNFPATDTTVANLAALVTRMDADLIAFQEIADIAAFTDLLAALPAYDGRYSPDVYTGGYQKTGFVWRRDLLSLIGTSSLFASNSYAFPRPPFQASFDITTCDGSLARVAFINVHLKASDGDPADDETNEARRRAAVVALKTYTDGLLQGGTPKVVVLGDFNDMLSAPADDFVFTAYANDPSHYTFATSTLDDGVEYTYIVFPHFFDHLLLSQALVPALVAADTLVLHLDELVTTYTYTSVISDHRPVLMQLERDNL